MKATQGTLIFSLELDGQLILYAFENFEITHGLTYSNDPTCRVTREDASIDFRFISCEIYGSAATAKKIILTPKETITDL